MNQDNSGAFYEFCNLCDTILNHNSRDKKKELIERFISDNEGKFDLYLLVRFLLIGKDMRVFHMREKSVIKVFSKMLTSSEEDLMDEFRASGDVSEVIAQAFRSELKTAKRSKCTLQKVEDALEKLSKSGKVDAQFRVLEKLVLRKLTRNEIKYLVRLLLKDLKIYAGQRTVLDAINPAANDCFTMGTELRTIIEKHQKGEDLLDLSQDLADSQDVFNLLPKYDVNDEDIDSDSDSEDKSPKMKRKKKMDDEDDDDLSTKKKKKKKRMTPQEDDEDEGEDVMISGTRKRAKKKDTPKHVKSPPKKRAKKVGPRSTVNSFVKPMLCRATKSFKDVLKRCPQGFLAELKYDGERIQIHKKDGKYKYFARSGKPTVDYKIQDVIKYIEESTEHVKDIILDGEILMVDTKTAEPLPFGALSKKNRDKNPNAQCAIFIFDILNYDGKSLLHISMETRREFLKKAVKEVPLRILISEAMKITNESDEEEKETLLATKMCDVIGNNQEGLVIKGLETIYQPNKRHWLKMKKDYLKGLADSADLVVLGAWAGKGDLYGGMLKVYLMGCYDKNTNTYKTVCKVGNGHNFETISDLDEHFTKIMKQINGDFSSLPSWLETDSTHVPDFCLVDNPIKIKSDQLVWEVAGFEFSKSDHHPTGISIRFPRVTRIREDKTVRTATNFKELKYLYEESKKKTPVALSSLINPSSKKKKTKKKKKKTKQLKLKDMMRDEDEDEEEEEDDEEDEDEETDIPESDVKNDKLSYSSSPVFKLRFGRGKVGLIAHCVAVGKRATWIEKGTMGGLGRAFGPSPRNTYENDRLRRVGTNQVIEIKDRNVIIVNMLCMRYSPKRAGFFVRKSAFSECILNLAKYIKEKHSSVSKKDEIKEIHVDRPHTTVKHAKNYVRKILNMHLLTSAGPRVFFHDRTYSGTSPNRYVSDERSTKGEEEEEQTPPAPMMMKTVRSVLKPPSQIFTDCDMIVYLRDGRDRICRLINEHGGKVSTKFDMMETTHVICDEYDRFKKEVDEVIKLDTVVVRSSWVEKSVTFKSRQMEQVFEINTSPEDRRKKERMVDEDDDEEEDDDKKRGETASKGKGLFQKCVFYIHKNVKDRFEVLRTVCKHGGVATDDENDEKISHFVSGKWVEGKETIKPFFVQACIKDSFLYPKGYFKNEKEDGDENF